jgi:hypothetical protein
VIALDCVILSVVARHHFVATARTHQLAPLFLHFCWCSRDKRNISKVRHLIELEEHGIFFTIANVLHSNFFVFRIFQLETHDVDVEGEQQFSAEERVLHFASQSFHPVSLIKSSQLGKILKFIDFGNPHCNF